MESPSFIETLRKLNPRAKSGFNAAVAQSCIEDCLSIFGMKRFSIEDLPKKYHNFAKKLYQPKDNMKTVIQTLHHIFRISKK